MTVSWAESTSSREHATPSNACKRITLISSTPIVLTTRPLLKRLYVPSVGWSTTGSLFTGELQSGPLCESNRPARLPHDLVFTPQSSNKTSITCSSETDTRRSTQVFLTAADMAPQSGRHSAQASSQENIMMATSMREPGELWWALTRAQC